MSKWQTYKVILAIKTPSGVENVDFISYGDANRNVAIQRTSAHARQTIRNSEIISVKECKRIRRGAVQYTVTT